ncbi:MAG: hypothetical protein A3I00_07950 [Betaproteobacteria bacterium RIFCSPLOWO2_02_FULL_64_12]|nr:MAG: hypothetical protein A3I00_07950 [Betaproteobacteria bacterium RIFCSPLOWO2_02_FULL_64_12]
MATERSAQNPPYVERSVDLPALLQKRSHFLFGPRQTGKSFLIRHTLAGVRVYDLLDHATYLALGQRPGRIAEEIAPRERVVVIDEIQRLPELLNEVHRGTIVNFTNVASDAQVPRTTVYEYFEILKDTLVLHELPA